MSQIPEKMKMCLDKSMVIPNINSDVRGIVEKKDHTAAATLLRVHS